MPKQPRSEMPSQPPDELVRIMPLLEVRLLTGYSRAGLAKLWSTGRFPEPVWIDGGRRRGFYSDEVEAWLAAQDEPE